MSLNYAPGQARDKNSEIVGDANFPKPALATTVGTPTVSSVVTFNSNTTAVEISVLGNIGTALAIKWGTASVLVAAGTANFDHVIPGGFIRRLVVPQSITGAGASVVGLNVQNGLYTALSAIASSASVIAQITEY